MNALEIALMEFAYQIRKYIKETNITPEIFSKLSDVSITTINSALMEKMICTDSMIKISKTLGVSLDTLRSFPDSLCLNQMQRYTLHWIQRPNSAYIDKILKIANQLPEYQRIRDLNWLRYSIEHPDAIYKQAPTTKKMQIKEQAMFQCKEFLKFYENEVLPKIADSYYNLTIECMRRFDTDIEAFEADCGGREPPIEKGAETAPFQEWHEAMIAQSKYACQIHSYYGMSLFYGGSTPEEVKSAPVIPEETLKQIPAYAVLANNSLQTTFQALNHRGSNPEYMDKWYKHHQKKTALYAKAYIWAGYLAAQKEAEVIEQVIKVTAKSGT